MSNSISALNEYFSQTLGIAGGYGDLVQQEYRKEGPDHHPSFSCRLIHADHTVEARGFFTTKKQAKHEAASLLLAALQTDSTPPMATDLRIDSMRGALILRLMLVEYFKERHTAAELQNLTTRYGNSSHLSQRYTVLVQLSLEMSAPTGVPQRDATQLEAWIARTYDEEGSRLLQTRQRVFPIVGVDVDA
jgi:hypothetical protein